MSQCVRHIFHIRAPGKNVLFRKVIRSCFSKKYYSSDYSRPLVSSQEFDFEYLSSEKNTPIIQENIQMRKGVGDIQLVQSLYQQWKTSPSGSEKDELWEKLIKAASLIPNKTHPQTPIGDESQAKLITMIGEKKDFTFGCLSVDEIGKKLGILRMENTTETTGHRSYYFIDSLVDLENALIEYTTNILMKKGFTLMSVPNIIHPSIIEGCGFSTTGERTQVYKLDPQMYGDACLAGTGEMPLAGFFTNMELPLDSLPQKVMTISPCYRAEASGQDEEKGIYRVHQFNKVEMFGVTADESGNESDELMEEFRNIQQQLFSGLGLHCRVLDMPSQELGAPAYRKYDIETWMPHKQFWGEISSTSNCTDYQSRRLNIRYKNTKGELNHVHTVNGTACALPRMIMALLETNQTEDGAVSIPDVLQPYMNGQKYLEKSSLPKLHWLRLTKNVRSKTKQKQH